MESSLARILPASGLAELAEAIRRAITRVGKADTAIGEHLRG